MPFRVAHRQSRRERGGRWGLGGHTACRGIVLRRNAGCGAARPPRYVAYFFHIFGIFLPRVPSSRRAPLVLPAKPSVFLLRRGHTNALHPAQIRVAYGVGAAPPQTSILAEMYIYIIRGDVYIYNHIYLYCL